MAESTGMELTTTRRALPLAQHLHGADTRPLKLPAQVADNKDDLVQRKLQKASQSFEGFMIGELLKAMRATEQTSEGILPTSRAEKMFTNQQCEALATIIAAREPLGLARLLRSNVGGTGGGSHEDREFITPTDQPSAASEPSDTANQD
jgi:Rod binding domain-containing protein